MPPVGFEPTIPVSERPKTHALDRTATGIGPVFFYLRNLFGYWVEEGQIKKLGLDCGKGVYVY
jgi:hypothetical protein